MATPNLSELATSTMEKRRGKAADNISENNALLYKLQDKAEQPIDGGRIIYEELLFDENDTVTSYSGAETLPVTQNDVLTAAEFLLKQYAASVVMTGLEELQNAGSSQSLKLLAQRIRAAEISLANRICADAYGDGTGNGSKNITGLDAAVPVNPLTGTYGGIDRSTALGTFWRSQVNDPASTPTISTILGEMLTLWLACSRGTDKPDLIISGQTLYKTFVGSLTPNQRFTDAKMAEAGFENVKFQSAPVIYDGGIGGNADATTMYFLNTKYLHWRPHVARNFAPIGKKRSAVNQDATVEILGFAGNMTCSGAQFQGRLIGS